MSFSLLILDYMQWHYREAPAALFHIWLNFMRYTEQLFSVRLHAHTLFAPWHRIVDKPRKKHNLEEWAASLVVNIISRVIGFLLRSFLILLGFVALALLTVIIMPAMLIWYAAPLIVTVTILVGITILLLTYGNTG